MKKFYFLALPLMFGIIGIITSCQKITPPSDSTRCAHATDGLIVKKWSSVRTQTDTYNSGGAITKTTYDHPSGFIQFNSTGLYTAASDGIVVNGKWSFDKNC